jgi:hypothetical protein
MRNQEGFRYGTPKILVSCRMARPRTGDTRKMVTLPAELAKAIEDYRFNSRLNTEAEAIRRLIELGLKAHESDAASTGSKG